MAFKRSTRKKRGGSKWNCSCTLASSPSTKAVLAVPVKQGDAARKLQTAVRQRQAAKNLTSKKAAATKLQSVARKRQAVQKLKTLKTQKKSAAPESTPAGLKSALAIQSAAMSPESKGMKALMAKPGMTEEKAKAILSRQSKKKEIATKIQSRSDGAISTTGAKRQAKKTLKKATKAQKKKPSKGGKKRKTRRLRSKRR